MPPKKPTMKTVYHEKQVALYCGKHAMNALLGEEKFVYEHGNTEIEIGDKINIYGICREQHEKFAKELAGLEAEAAIDPEAIESMIEAFDVETHIPCDADGNFVSATLTMCLKRLGFGVGRDDAEGATGG